MAEASHQHAQDMGEWRVMASKLKAYHIRPLEIQDARILMHSTRNLIMSEDTAFLGCYDSGHMDVRHSH
jgi:hypothetical protein